MPHRLQRQRTKGYRLPAGTISCTRPGRYGNPHAVAQLLAPLASGRRPDYEQKLHAAAEAVRLFHNELAERYHADPAALAAWLAPLRGKDLACWCPVSQPCHADHLLTLANSPTVLWHRYHALRCLGREWTSAEAAEVAELQQWLTEQGIISSAEAF